MQQPIRICTYAPMYKAKNPRTNKTHIRTAMQITEMVTQNTSLTDLKRVNKARHCLKLFDYFTST